jgi:hypothetical protein
MWKYKWQSPSPSGWSSEYTFPTFIAAKENAIYNALMQQKRSPRRLKSLDSTQKAALWRSLRRAGWRIRKKQFSTTSPQEVDSL